jgi:cobalt/nickel transport system permease protein
MYTAAGAGWYASLRRVRRTLNARMIPLISVFAAFCFVIMMFNLPLPGGTTGHAVGVTMAAIVLGPAGAILAASIALTIQALFFGDGGITTLGANCFNIAIIGSLVAYGVYRAIAARAPVTARRRVVAGAIAGYIAINAAALFAAIEFGIQPALFHDSQGVPLYAPYPLRIAVPAMMVGHLLVAGIAEAAVTAGLVAFVQSADPALLLATSGLNAVDRQSAAPAAASLKRLWITVALLMCLTPLGVLAAGSAWGEWSTSEMPHTMQTASAFGTATADPPAGLLRLSTVWTAPIPAYAPPFVKSVAFGYLLSAMFAVGLLMLFSWLGQRLLARRRSGEAVS